MCGIFGLQTQDNDLNLREYSEKILKHRGPDGFGTYENDEGLFLSHNRLSIIDLNPSAAQPMRSNHGAVIVFNGEIYNYKELKATLLQDYNFRTNSDTEVILALYHKYGSSCVDHLRGMFAFAIWDEVSKVLFCARDRFGIKPFYYIREKDKFGFASEIKALLPFISDISTNQNVLGEYLVFQYPLACETLFNHVSQLMPGHYLTLYKGNLKITKYWDIKYEIDYEHPAQYFEEKLHSLFLDSVNSHLVSDVPVGSYLSGGIDSSLVTGLGASFGKLNISFNGRFTEYPGYDESDYARICAESTGVDLHIADITHQDFLSNIEKVIYHLDVPMAGPGSFPQFMVSQLASKHVKVVLGGQGGDEIFGGYARYVIAYFEQAIKAAIDGTYKNGNFVVTPESIIPNLTMLQEYKPLITKLWQEGLFGPLDDRYFRLIDRSTDFVSEVDWSLFDKDLIVSKFKSIFNNKDNVRKEAYFDKMTHFDFKCLLPALLHVEDRMSMAHSIESRVPFLDHQLIEFAATIPANIKFSDGRMKHLLKTVFSKSIPEPILNRRDKMGFPVPLNEWFQGPLKGFINDIFSSSAATTRGFYDPKIVLKNLNQSAQYSRKIWALLSLELWHRQFHDQKTQIKNTLKQTQGVIL